MNIKHHARIMLSGFVRTLGGALTAGLFSLSVYGFASIPKEGGYGAVGDFVGAIVVLFLALLSMYVLGAGKGRKKRKGSEPQRGLFLAK